MFFDDCIYYKNVYIYIYIHYIYIVQIYSIYAYEYLRADTSACNFVCMRVRMYLCIRTFLDIEEKRRTGKIYNECYILCVFVLMGLLEFSIKFWNIIRTKQHVDDFQNM
jgi:hypothetical protein